MKHKLLIVSATLLFVALVANSINASVANIYGGDYGYYSTSGLLGQGHDLTLVIARPLSMVASPLVPVFFNLFFVFSVCFLIKPFVKRYELAVLLATLLPVGVIFYAQFFAMSLFYLALGFYFRGKTKSATIFMLLMPFAHFWAGFALLSIFLLYATIKDFEAFYKIGIPTLSIVIIMAISLGSPFAFLSAFQGNVAKVFGTIKEFFVKDMQAFSLFAIPGLVVLYLEGRSKLFHLGNPDSTKMRNFFTINLMMVVIPLLALFVVPLDYLGSRILFFVPVLLLSVVFCDAMIKIYHKMRMETRRKKQ